MLNELNPNERPERRSRRVGLPEITFGAGFVLAVAGLAIVAVPAALLVAGVLLMIVAWRMA